jgi:hypothetical protein
MMIEIKLERLLNTTERSRSQAQAVDGKETHRACNCYTGSYSRTAFRMERMDMPPFYLAYPSPPLMAIHFSLPASFHGS